MLSKSELSSIHGTDERLAITELKKGIDARLSMLIEGAAVMIP